MIRISLTLLHIHIHTLPRANRQGPNPILIHISPLSLSPTTPSTTPEDLHRLIHTFTSTLFLKLYLITSVHVRKLSHNPVPTRILKPHPIHTIHILIPHLSPIPIPIPTPPLHGPKKTSTPSSPTCMNAYQTWGGCLMVPWDRLGFRWRVIGVMPGLMLECGVGVVAMQILDLGVDRRILDWIPKQFSPLPLHLLLHQVPALGSLSWQPIYGDIRLPCRRII